MSPAPTRRNRRPALVVAFALLLVVAGLVGVGCGSSANEEEGTGFPPAAEPASSPAIATVPAGASQEVAFGELEGIVADPKTGLVAIGSRNPDGVVLVKNAGTKGAEFELVMTPESPRHMQLAGPGGPVIFGAERSNQLVEVKLPGGEVSTTSVGEFPHDATEGPDGRTFVANEQGNTISVVSDGVETDVLEAPVQPGGVAVASGTVGTVAVAERVLGVYDADTLERGPDIDLGVGPTHVVADDDRFYVTDTEGDAVLIVRTEPEVQIIDRINVPGKPYGIAINRESGTLWVTQTELNQVIELKLRESGAPKKLRTFPTIQQPNTVAVDPFRNFLYVAGRANGDLQAIDLDTKGN